MAKPGGGPDGGGANQGVVTSSGTSSSGAAPESSRRACRRRAPAAWQHWLTVFVVGDGHAGGGIDQVAELRRSRARRRRRSACRRRQWPAGRRCSGRSCCRWRRTSAAAESTGAGSTQSPLPSPPSSATHWPLASPVVSATQSPLLASLPSSFQAVDIDWSMESDMSVHWVSSAMDRPSAVVNCRLVLRSDGLASRRRRQRRRAVSNRHEPNDRMTQLSAPDSVLRPHDNAPSSSRPSHRARQMSADDASPTSHRGLTNAELPSLSFGGTNECGPPLQRRSLANQEAPQSSVTVRTRQRHSSVGICGQGEFSCHSHNQFLATLGFSDRFTANPVRARARG